MSLPFCLPKPIRLGLVSYHLECRWKTDWHQAWGPAAGRTSVGWRLGVGMRTPGPRKKLQTCYVVPSGGQTYPFIRDSDRVPAKAQVLGDCKKKNLN